MQTLHLKEKKKSETIIAEGEREKCMLFEL